MARQGREPLLQSIRDAALCSRGSPDLDAALKEYGALMNHQVLKPLVPYTLSIRIWCHII